MFWVDLTEVLGGGTQICVNSACRLYIAVNTHPLLSFDSLFFSTYHEFGLIHTSLYGTETYGYYWNGIIQD